MVGKGWVLGQLQGHLSFSSLSFCPSQSCWNEYLTTRIEQNLVLNCTCPIADCPAQPTGAFIRAIVSSPEVISKVSSSLRGSNTEPKGLQECIGLWGAGSLVVWHPGEPCPHLVAPVALQYEKALLRGYVESCSNLTWCTNPQGCDRILCRQGLGCGTTCSKCGWASCFNCSFPEVAALPMPCPDQVFPLLPCSASLPTQTVACPSSSSATLLSSVYPSVFPNVTCFLPPSPNTHQQGHTVRAHVCPHHPLLL